MIGYIILLWHFLGLPYNHLLSTSAIPVPGANCDPLGEFPCDDSMCVPWRKVCNLEKDCNNGRDEDLATCGKNI